MVQQFQILTQKKKKRGISLSASIAPIEFDDTKINLVDIPGYFDFSGELIQGMRAVDVATIVYFRSIRSKGWSRKGLGLLQ